MAWEGSDRGSRLPANWAAIKKTVHESAGYRCQSIMPDGRRCPNQSRDVDHRIPGDDHSLENLAAICGPHHAAKSSSEGGFASAEARRKKYRHSRRRAQEAHWRPTS